MSAIANSSIFAESNCKRHVRCPRCEAHGRDTSGDNLAIYDDGHGHCFSCGFYQPAKLRDKLKKIKRPPNNKMPTVLSANSATTHTQSIISTPKSEVLAFAHNQKNFMCLIDRYEPTREMQLPKDFIWDIPTKGLNWLAEFGITKDEIRDYGLGWSDLFDGVVFPIYNNQNHLVMYQVRQGFSTDSKRYHTVGYPANVHLIIGKSKNPELDGIVLVEDMLSAIKIGRHMPACCLFGSSIDSYRLAALMPYFKSCNIWLDKDKQDYVNQEVLMKAVNFFPNCRSISTKDDPKANTDAEIRKALALT